MAMAWALAAAQWWRSRRSVAGISSLSWATFLAVNLSWCAYGLGMRNPYLVTNTVGAAAFNCALLWRIDIHRWRTGSGVAACALGSAALGLLVGWPTVAMVCFALAFTVRGPQILQALRAPDLSGISLTSWTLAVVNNSLWTAIGIQCQDWWFAAANVGLVLTTATLIAVVQFRRHLTERTPSPQTPLGPQYQPSS